MTYFFETYGCQMNIAESASVEQLLIARGWEKSKSVQTADLVIINTCSVRATAENRIIGRLGFFSGLKSVRNRDFGAKYKSLEEAAEYVKDGAKPLTLVVMGCMAERLLETFQKDYPFIDYVVGTYAKHHFGKIIEAVQEGEAAQTIDDSEAYRFAPLSYEAGSSAAFVPIMHGCNNFCTYCIVPYVRGRECSRKTEEILAEIDTLSSYGVKEITLLGQNVNSYKSSFNNKKIDFADLLKIIADHIKEKKSSIGWVRFMSSHPKDLSQKVMNTIAENEVLCRHIHLPIQHGSSSILKRMNRCYSAEEYLLLIEKIKNTIPNVSLTTDLMMGFPGETEEDVEKTIEIMKKVRYETAFMYYYNPREGTPAATFENQVPIKIKKQRLQRIIDLQLEITAEEMKKQIGQTIKVLAESVSRDNKAELLGKTERDERIAFAADKKLIGSFVNVYIDSLNGNTFKGTMV